MEPRHLGRSGLRVSPLFLGTVNFGHVTPPRTADRIMSAALDQGIFCFDTADSYNRDQGEDCTEAIVGRWLAADPSRRSRIVLATKVFGTVGDGPNDRGLSARHLILECEQSLRRLGTDWIDLYFLHHVDRSVPWDETLEALDRLQRQGKILYYGTSNFAAWQLTGFHWLARSRGMLGQACEQSIYNLRHREVETEVLPACRHHGIGFLAYSPLDEGVLAGPGVGRRRGFPTNAARRRDDAERLEAWHARCARHGLAPAQAALSWVIAQPGVTAALIGPRTPEQLDSAVAAVRLAPDAAVLEDIGGEWPGHAEAPESYAW